MMHALVSALAALDGTPAVRRKHMHFFCDGPQQLIEQLSYCFASNTSQFPYLLECEDERMISLVVRFSNIKFSQTEKLFGYLIKNDTKNPIKDQWPEPS